MPVPPPELPATLLREFAAVAGDAHVLTGDAAAGYAVDWTGGFTGQTPAVLRPRDTAEVAALLKLCADAGVAVVPQGGNTGLVGGGVPLHGEVVLSVARLNRLGPVDADAGQVDAGAGVSLQQVADADPGLDLGVFIASRHSACDVAGWPGWALAMTGLRAASAEQKSLPATALKANGKFPGPSTHTGLPSGP